MLYFAAEWLVKGSSNLAQSLGVKKIVIGLTVVAFGTSAPELVISIVSSIQGKSMIAVGNVVGSNICNIALILGLSTLFQPISCTKSLINRDIPIMLGISLFLVLLTLDSKLGRFDGATLVCGIILYVFLNYSFAMKKPGQRAASEDSSQTGLEEIGDLKSKTSQIVLIILGIVGVVAGAQFVVDSAVKIMTVLGVSEKFVGLTIIAFGTSLPELATSVIAAVKKEMDISIGNLVGSNVFNIMSVLGASSLIKPIIIHGGFVHSGLLVDYMVMILTGLLPLLMMKKSGTLSRIDGVILLTCYAGYLFYLIARQ